MGTVLCLVFLVVSTGCASSTVDTNDSLSVLTLNIWNNKGDWPARRSIILSELRTLDPDVIFLQEVLENPTLPNQAHQIADSIGFNYYFSSVDSVGRAKRYGNAILTRLPIQSADWHPLKPLNDYRTIGHVLTRWNGRLVDLYVTHLHHRQDSIGAEIRMIQVKDALAYIDSTRANSELIFAGDFNADPGAKVVARIHERFRDSNDAVDRPTTLNTGLGHVPRWIDYVFADESTGLRATSVERVMDVMSPDSIWASDHFGVAVQFELAR